MADILLDPVRIVALPFVGDPWAQPGSQAAIPSEVQRLTVTAELRWRVIAYDGIGASAKPVDGDMSTFDMTIVKLRKDRHGNVTLARTVTLVESGGVVLVGNQLTESDVSPSELVCLGVVSATGAGASALWIFVDSGAKLTAGSRGTA